MQGKAIVQAGVVAGVVMLGAEVATAATLGIPLDAFLGQFQTFVVGLGLLVGLVGLLGFVGAQFDNPFSHMLAGTPSLFVRAGLLGGGTVILGAVGLVSGAVLP